MSEEKEKVENGKEILHYIKGMRSSYEAAEIDEQEEDMRFLDKLNRLVQLILKDETFSVYTTLDAQSLKKWHQSRFTRAIKKLLFSNYQYTLYFILLATITGFLVSEALSFYAIDGLVSTKTYVKAILTEVCFIFLSGYRASTVLEKVWTSFLRGGIFILMMFVISSQTLDIGTKTISENENIAQQVVLIQEQIKEKEKDIEYFKSIKWPRNAARTTLEKQELVKKLIALKEAQASGKNEDVSEIERYKMYGRASFRVLLLLISVLITRRIFTF